MSWLLSSYTSWHSLENGDLSEDDMISLLKKYLSHAIALLS